MDEKEGREHCIGTFRNGQNFGIFLPKADLSEAGNLSLTINNEISFEAESSKFPSELIKRDKEIEEEEIDTNLGEEIITDNISYKTLLMRCVQQGKNN